MTKDDLKKYNLPELPGVYFFNNKKGEKIYIGKATNLNDRIKSYFVNNLMQTRGPLLVKMITESESVSFQETDSVLEALILEAGLIKKYKPLYNSKGKDDKTYQYIVITAEDYPRVLIVRAKNLNDFIKKNKIRSQFGPFPNVRQLKTALLILQKIFKFYDTKKTLRKTDANRQANHKINFYRQLGLYPKEHDKIEYNKSIKELETFLNGKKQLLLKQLEKEMKYHAEKQEFEQAAKIRDKIYSLEHIVDVALIKDESIEGAGQDVRIEAYDVSHWQGKNMVGVMVVIEDGMVKTEDIRRFKIKDIEKSDDVAATGQLVTRRLKHREWTYPNIIVVDGSWAQKRAVEQIVRSHNFKIPVLGVVKDNKHRPKQIIGQAKLIKKYKKLILLANHEAHRQVIRFHRKIR